jgi:hypothetical protein
VPAGEWEIWRALPRLERFSSQPHTERELGVDLLPLPRGVAASPKAPRAVTQACDRKSRGPVAWSMPGESLRLVLSQMACRRTLRREEGGWVRKAQHAGLRCVEHILVAVDGQKNADVPLPHRRCAHAYDADRILLLPMFPQRKSSRAKSPTRTTRSGKSTSPTSTMSW